MYPSSDANMPRPVAKPLLAMTAILTVAWFAIAAVTIAASNTQHAATGYGIDVLGPHQQLAQR